MHNFGTGFYQCYCESRLKKVGTIDIFANENDLCYTYVWDGYGGKALSLIVSMSIVVINIILRTIMMTLIKFIGYHTESEQTKNIKTSIFVT